jgi:riboflavin kinase/FMN adenylyltransferase
VKIVRGLDAIEGTLEHSVLTIGNFDGFHRGHQQLVAQSALLAANDKAPVVALTFEPHPLEVVRPESAPPRLSTLNTKLALLSQAGVDVTVVADSNPELLGMEPEAFVERLATLFRPIHIVEGSTFGFGKGRRGTPQMLVSLGERFGYAGCIIEPVKLQIEYDESVPVSSSLIRGLLNEGKARRAALCLGRCYSIEGRVAPGEGRGADLGFRTANLEDVQQLIPADGVYAGAARIRDERVLAAISIGTNPTFEGTRRKLEAHLIDFKDEIVGETIDVEMGIWLRAQRKFESVQSLSGQIEADVSAVREWGRLAAEGPGECAI